MGEKYENLSQRNMALVCEVISAHSGKNQTSKYLNTVKNRCLFIG
jgi:hypothetical protein